MLYQQPGLYEWQALNCISVRVRVREFQNGTKNCEFRALLLYFYMTHLKDIYEYCYSPNTRIQWIHSTHWHSVRNCNASTLNTQYGKPAMQNFLNPCSITWIVFSCFRHFVACTQFLLPISKTLISLTLQLLVLGCVYSMRIRIFPSIIKLHKLYDETHLHITRSIHLFSLSRSLSWRKD